MITQYLSYLVCIVAMINVRVLSRSKRLLANCTTIVLAFYHRPLFFYRNVVLSLHVILSTTNIVANLALIFSVVFISRVAIELGILFVDVTNFASLHE